MIAYRKRPMPRTAEPTCRTYPIPHVHPLALTGHRERLCLTLLLAAFFFCLLLLPQTVRGANWYAFHQVADYGSLAGNYPLDRESFIDTELSWQHPLGVPSMNASGQVAFLATGGSAYDLANFWQDIFKGGVGSLQKPVSANGLKPHFLLDPSINDLADLGYAAWEADSESAYGLSGVSRIVRYKESTKSNIIIAEGDLTDNSATFRAVRGGSINNAGTVAFQATPHSNSHEEDYVMAGTGGNTVVVDVVGHLETFPFFSAPPPNPYFYPPDIRAFPLISVDSPNLDVLRIDVDTGTIKVGGSLNWTVVAQDGSSEFVQTNKYTKSISNTAAVSFVANPVGPIDEGVYVAAGGAPMLVADTSGEFDDFGSTSVSAAGVAFKAKKDLGDWGLYTGPNPLSDKVLTAGDTILGHPSPVDIISINPTAMNDKGQIAMRVLFEDSTQKIVRADPFTLQTVGEAWMAMAAIKTEGDASMFQLVEFAPGNESLAFDFAFPAETGNLVVSLGGQVLVELDALAGVADDLTRFETEVDLAALFPEGTSQALLEFQLYSNDATAGLYLDNIHFASLENGDFASGDLSAWQSSFAAGDGVGVAVNPYGPSPAVPEPATLLLVLFGLALLPRRRRGKLRR